ncbi:hypothetical protein SLH46_12205 [Draconibacterium sp. IB214405]|uniref:hypothetical protein n=1 Tax=Draconibacterium sp. IB214405 TaxID=3097352 RepID=UPI002A0D28A2|nr:hypothetical protein [Draconibacterium sp. IB214405]MDX8339953.1 hypothetical protein [Draconibacterium sp. IB214405]
MIKKSVIFNFLLYVSIVATAQVPSGLPSGKPDPLELTLPNIIFFIVIPVLIIILYIIRRRNRRK